MPGQALSDPAFLYLCGTIQITLILIRLLAICFYEFYTCFPAICCSFVTDTVAFNGARKHSFG